MVRLGIAKVGWRYVVDVPLELYLIQVGLLSLFLHHFSHPPALIFYPIHFLFTYSLSSP